MWTIDDILQEKIAIQPVDQDSLDEVINLLFPYENKDRQWLWEDFISFRLDACIHFHEGCMYYDDLCWLNTEYSQKEIMGYKFIENIDMDSFEQIVME